MSDRWVEERRARALCYFRILVYTTYREARHLGTDRATAIGWHPDFVNQAPRCERAKEAEPHGVFRRLHAYALHETTTEAIVVPYRQLTGIDLEQLPLLFGPRAQWRPRYGGPRWERIATETVGLRSALVPG